MNLVDSCGWLEFYSGGPNAARFAPAILETGRLLVPSICIYEVFKRIVVQFGEKEALAIVSDMAQGTVCDLDKEIAMDAANLSLEHHLPMADNIILTTARLFNAIIWTQDEHFKKFHDVKYFEKK